MNDTHTHVVDASSQLGTRLPERPPGRRPPSSSGAVDFALDEALNLPVAMTHHRLDGKVLFIVPEKALWLTTTELGGALLQCLWRGKSLRHSLEEIGARTNASSHEVERELRGLLRQIAIKNFYETCVPEEAAADSAELNLQIHLTQSCNLRCKHCYMDSGLHSRAELDVAEWKGVIDQFMELGGTSLTYSGGEPLLFPDFFELAAYAKGKTLETLLITNGTLIKSAAMAKSLARVVDKTRVSVDGATPEGHEAIRGHGSFARMRRALILLAEAGVPVEIAVTLYPENTNDIVDNLSSFLDDLSDLGVEPAKVGIARGMLQGRASATLKLLDFEENFLKIKRRTNGPLWDLKRFKALKVTHCGYGQGLTVSSIGAVYPCGLLNRAGDNVRKEPLDAIFARFQAEGRASMVEQLRPCRKCDLRHICGGGCRVAHRETTGDVCRAACSKQYREAYYRRLIMRDEVFFKVSAMLDASIEALSAN